MVSGLAMPRSKKTGATCAKTRRNRFNRAVRKLAKSGKVLRALLSAVRKESIGYDYVDYEEL